MIMIREKLGQLALRGEHGKPIDSIALEWHETGRRISRKRSRMGEELVLRFLKEAPALSEGDILYEDEARIIVVEIRSCECIVLEPRTLYDMALACYEIGNKHLPLFYEEGSILMPYDAPVFRMLEGAGFAPRREARKLLQPLRTSVAPHAHAGGSLLTRILDWTNTEADD
jgi:urease accessory protein